MLAVVNGFGGFGRVNIPSRLQGLGYLKGLGQTVSVQSPDYYLSTLASGSALVNGSISRANYLNTMRDNGDDLGRTIQTELWSLFQGTYTNYGGPITTAEDYFNRWVTFLQGSAARAIATKWVNWKTNDIAAREAGTVGTPEAIAASNVIAQQNVDASLQAAQAAETQAVQAIRDVQATIPPNYVVPAPATAVQETVRPTSVRTTPAVIIPYPPNDTVLQGSPDPSGAIYASGGVVPTSMQANDVLAVIPGPSSEVFGFNIPWLLVGGAGLLLFMATRKKGR